MRLAEVVNLRGGLLQGVDAPPYLLPEGTVLYILAGSGGEHAAFHDFVGPELDLARSCDVGMCSEHAFKKRRPASPNAGDINKVNSIYLFSSHFANQI